MLPRVMRVGTPTTRGMFAVGAETGIESIASMAHAVLGSRDMAVAGATTLAGILVAFALAGLLIAWRTAIAWRARAVDPRLVFCAGTALVALASVIVLHVGFGLRYPAERTGLHLVVPFAMALGLAATSLGSPARIGVGLAVGCFGVAALSNLRPLEQRAWPADAASRPVLARLQAQQVELGRPLRIACSWDIAPSYQFYLRTGAAPWIGTCDVSLEPGVEYDAFVLHLGARGARLESTNPDGSITVRWNASPGGERRVCLRGVAEYPELGVLLLAPGPVHAAPDRR